MKVMDHPLVPKLADFYAAGSAGFFSRVRAACGTYNHWAKQVGAQISKPAGLTANQRAQLLAGYVRTEVSCKFC